MVNLVDKKFINDRLGKRCVSCGGFIFIQSELSLFSCDPLHKQCEQLEEQKYQNYLNERRKKSK